MAMGAVMVVVALAMVGDYDTRFQTAIANDLPGFLVNPTGDLEETDGVRDELAGLRGACRRDRRRRRAARSPARTPAGAASACRCSAPRPDFTGNQQWFNTPGGRPLTLRGLRGRVVLVDFWTYTCINCIRTLPYLKAWDERYRDEGLTIVGVHTPEFPFERDAGNVATRSSRTGSATRSPRTTTTRPGTPTANQYWPAKYLIDAQGRVRYAHFGEGEYEETEAAIRELLAEAGQRPGAPAPRRAVERLSGGDDAGELPRRAARRAVRQRADRPRLRDFELPAAGLPDDSLAYGGTWRIGLDGATAVGGARARHRLRRRAASSSCSAHAAAGRATVRVLLDGRPLPDALAGSDVRRRRRHHPRAAALPPRRPATRRAPPPHARTRARRVRLRLHLRMSAAAATIGPHGRPGRSPHRARRRRRADDRRGRRALPRARRLRGATAADGLEALRLADESRPRPGRARPDAARLDGLEVLRRLREGEGGRTPVILLTAKGEQDDGSSACAAAPTTTSSSPSRRASWSPASTRCCDASARPATTPSRCPSTASRSTPAAAASPSTATRSRSASASSTCSHFLASIPARCSRATS